MYFFNKEDKSSPRHRGSDFPSENKEDKSSPRHRGSDFPSENKEDYNEKKQDLKPVAVSFHADCTHRLRKSEFRYSRSIHHRRPVLAYSAY